MKDKNFNQIMNQVYKDKHIERKALYYMRGMSMYQKALFELKMATKGL